MRLALPFFFFFEGGCNKGVKPAASSQPLKITATQLFCERMYSETGVPSFFFGGGARGDTLKFGCLLQI